MPDSESLHVFYVVMYEEWFGFWTYSYTTWTRPRFKPRDYEGFVSKIRCHPLRLIRYMFDSRKVELFKDQVLLCSSVLVPSAVSFCLSRTHTQRHTHTHTHTVEQGKIIDVKQLDPNKHSKWVSCRDTHVCNSWTHSDCLVVDHVCPWVSCVLVKKKAPETRSNSRLYRGTRSRRLTTAGVVSTSVKSFHHNDILDSTPQRWPTHILSDNQYHLMCICEE